MPAVFYWGAAIALGGWGVNKASEGLGNNAVKVAAAGFGTFLILKKAKVI